MLRRSAAIALAGSWLIARGGEPAGCSVADRADRVWVAGPPGGFIAIGLIEGSTAWLVLRSGIWLLTLLVLVERSYVARRLDEFVPFIVVPNARVSSRCARHGRARRQRFGWMAAAGSLSPTMRFSTARGDVCPTRRSVRRDRRRRLALGMLTFARPNVGWGMRRSVVATLGGSPFFSFRGVPDHVEQAVDPVAWALEAAASRGVYLRVEHKGSSWPRRCSRS